MKDINLSQYLYFQQVDDNNDFSSPTVNENTSTNDTFSLTKTVSGMVYWRVRAWDQLDWGLFRVIRTTAGSVAAIR